MDKDEPLELLFTLLVVAEELADKVVGELIEVGEFDEYALQAWGIPREVLALKEPMKAVQHVGQRRVVQVLNGEERCIGVLLLVREKPP